MKRRKIILIILGIIYSLLLFCKKSEIHFPFISDYLSDLICIPLTLLLTEIIIAKIPGISFRIGFWQIFVAVVYFTLVFEFWMPSVSVKHTSDYIDIICYVIGGAAYYFFGKKSTSFTKAVQPV